MFEICKSKNGQYYTRLISKNGKVLMCSELFDTKANARKNTTAVDRLWGGMLDLKIVDMTHTITPRAK